MADINQENSDILKGYSMLLYFAGSFILNEPSEECIQDIAAGDLFRKLPVKSKNPNYILASSFLNNINKKSVQDFDEILADYLTLFGSSGFPQAPPFESYYTESGKVRQDHVPGVHYTYNAYGWQAQPACRQGSGSESVPEDHLGIELQFLNLLIEKKYDTEDDICRKELTRDTRKFIDNHLRPWLSDWNRRMQSSAISNFYKGIGYLVLACVQDVYHLV
ncbi:MAG: molecular chaperone TorD family protein [Marinilabiliaceae bacterium]|jgi:TorA maturation chaperone TorD|nr:molecular chaperone TorD family protein [Marinilabiliaceae bacterium]